jgi:hypothetical protein
MTTSARDIIKKSLQKIGALVKNEDPSADEANDALDALNGLIDSWSNDSSTIPSRAWETFTLQGGVTTYTMAPGLTFNTTRPTNIIGGYIRIGTIDYPLTVVTDEAYNSITFKSLTGIPEFINYDNAYPTDNVRLYPAPSAAYSIFLLSEKPLASFATLDTVVSLPAGWVRTLVYNLAIELAPEYSQPPDQSIFKIANDSLAMVRLSAIRSRPMDAYPQKMSVRNIYSGWAY